MFLGTHSNLETAFAALRAGAAINATEAVHMSCEGLMATAMKPAEAVNPVGGSFPKHVEIDAKPVSGQVHVTRKCNPLAHHAMVAHCQTV